jgi:hypothetical protein
VGAVRTWGVGRNGVGGGGGLEGRGRERQGVEDEEDDDTSERYVERDLASVSSARTLSLSLSLSLSLCLSLVASLANADDGIVLAGFSGCACLRVCLFMHFARRSMKYGRGGEAEMRGLNKLRELTGREAALNLIAVERRGREGRNKKYIGW